MDNIDTATMKPDGTIVLSLRADDGAGVIGHAVIIYPPNYADYRNVLTHLDAVMDLAWCNHQVVGYGNCP